MDIMDFSDMILSILVNIVDNIGNNYIADLRPQNGTQQHKLRVKFTPFKIYLFLGRK